MKALFFWLLPPAVVIGIAVIFFTRPPRVEVKEEMAPKASIPAQTDDAQAQYQSRIRVAETYERMARETRDPKEKVKLLKRAGELRGESTQP